MSAIVMCRVSGGVTGIREAPLKQDGKVRHFETLDEAKAEAARLDKDAYENPYRSADFRYYAVAE